MPDPGSLSLSTDDAGLSVDEARAAILAAIRVALGGSADDGPPDRARSVCEVETVPLAAALGRVLAADVVSPIDVPAHDNSAMDGYALRGCDLPGQAAGARPLGATAASVVRLGVHPTAVHAGDTPPADVPPGVAVRIMTGAVMPAGLDTVVPQERCRVLAEGRAIEVDAGVVAHGDHRRLRGEDLSLGQPALRAGRVLRPADLGLVASLGLANLPVRRRLRVAVFSTGNELCEPGQPLEPGCIYDSNRPALLAALARLGVEPIDLGRVRDDPAALEATLTRAVQVADAVVTSGGVSVGEADHTRALLARLGEVAFWTVAMRPGRHVAFGPLRAQPEGPGADAATTPGRAAALRWLFALPGNPVASLVAFDVFVRDALLALAGATPAPPPALQARSSGPIRKRSGRTEFQRGVLSRDADGRCAVRLTGAQGSGILRSLSEANALVVLSHSQGPVAAGESVEVWPFDGLV
jgi:molybdopterin molybdotransferase